MLQGCRQLLLQNIGLISRKRVILFFNYLRKLLKINLLKESYTSKSLWLKYFGLYNVIHLKQQKAAIKTLLANL